MTTTRLETQATGTAGRYHSTHAGTDGVHALWAEYKRTGDPELRNRLVLQYSPLVKFVVGRLRSGLPQSVDQADLVSEGVIGLIDAIDKFEPGRGLEFQTYAVPRIRGAVLDSLRAADWVPRSVRAKVREVERAHAELQARLNRSPTDQEVAEATSMTTGELRDLYGKAAASHVSAADDLVLADDSPSPEDALEDEATRSALLSAVRELRERDQIVIALYYLEGFTLSEVGQVLSVTESRVSQLHSRATMALRSKLATLHAG